jgi:hypothetical protein
MGLCFSLPHSYNSIPIPSPAVADQTGDADDQERESVIDHLKTYFSEHLPVKQGLNIIAEVLPRLVMYAFRSSVMDQPSTGLTCVIKALPWHSSPKQPPIGVKKRSELGLIPRPMFRKIRFYMIGNTRVEDAGTVDDSGANANVK